LWVAIHGFSGGGPQEDDMTALVLCHLPLPDPHVAGASEMQLGKVFA
jgi:hypothetical protein